MFNIGPLELMVILVVALLVVGPQRLPEVARSVGRGLREFRKAQDEVQRTLQLTLEEPPEEPAKSVSTASTAASAEARLPGSDSSATGENKAGEPEDSTSTGAAVSGGASAGAAIGDVASTLGRGLAELRRVREELQRSFRVDLDDEEPPRRVPAPAPTSEPTAESVPAPAAEATPPGEPGDEVIPDPANEKS